jgi:hypothetical protein
MFGHHEEGFTHPADDVSGTGAGNKCQGGKFTWAVIEENVGFFSGNNVNCPGIGIYRN